MCANKAKHHPADIRTEYAALSSFYNLVVNHRFILLGFFITVMGIIIKDGITFEKALILFIFTIGMYMVELRNRVLYNEISSRGMQIERECWGFTGKEEAYIPFYSRLIKVKPSEDKDPDAGEPKQEEKPYVFKREWKINAEISHTCGLDIIYWSSFLFCFIQILINLPPCIKIFIKCFVTMIEN